MDYRISHYNNIEMKNITDDFFSLLSEKRLLSKWYDFLPFIKSKSKVFNDTFEKEFETALYEYKNIEDKYINILKELLEENNIEKMKIDELKSSYIFINLKNYKKITDRKNIKYIKRLRLKNGKEYMIKDILEIIRLSLRGTMWCNIIGKKIYINTGYGYHVNIGGLEIDKTIMRNGIIIEETKNP